MFTRIDNWLLDSVFQPAADAFWDRYERTHFWLAATCIYGYLGLFLLDVLLEVDSEKVTTSGMAWFHFTMVLILALSLDYEGRRKQNVTRTMNPRRSQRMFKLVRYLLVLSFGVNIFTGAMALLVHNTSIFRAGLDILQTVLCGAAFYFASCDKRPPDSRPRSKKAKAPRRLSTRTT